MNISAVIPTINSEKIIKKAVDHIEEYIKKNKLISDYEIIIAAQTSDDNTFEVIKKLKSKKIKSLFIKPRGKGIGLNEGIKKAKYPWVVMIDDDLSYPIEFLDRAIKKTKKNHIIIGSRYLTKQKIPFMRKLAAYCYRKFVKLLFRLPQEDIQSGLKLIKKEIFKKIKIKEKGYVWDTELLYKANKAGFKITEIPIRYDFVGNKLSLRNAAPKMFAGVMKLRINTFIR